ncbi:hypothetical protein pb186bvf_014822 [Paramecium bursaria]
MSSVVSIYTDYIPNQIIFPIQNFQQLFTKGKDIMYKILVMKIESDQYQILVDQYQETPKIYNLLFKILLMKFLIKYVGCYFIKIQMQMIISQIKI